MNRKLLSILVCLMLVLAGCGTGANPSAGGDNGGGAGANGGGGSGGDVIVLRIGCTSAEDSNYALGMYKFEELLEEYTDGRVDVQVFPNSQLGDERDLVEGVALGTIEMCVTSTGPLPGISEAFMILDLPFVFENRDVAFAFMDGASGQEILDTLQPKGILALGFWENGYRNITSNFPIYTPEDIRGMKIRTMENEVHLKAFEVFGANPVPMAWSEVYSALQQGVIDGHENALISIWNHKIYEVNDHLAMTNHLYSAAVIMINDDLFNSFDADIQEAILRAEREAREWEREFSANLDVELREELANVGVTITDVDVSVWKAAAQPTYDAYAERINQEHLAEIQSLS